MKVLITQSNYIPWKGYFRSLIAADKVIFLDDVQYTKRDWRNRNKIKTLGGVKWLTVPVETAGKYYQSIQDVLISDKVWYQKHLDTLRHAYKNAPYFEEIYELLSNYFHKDSSLYLSEINIGLIRLICEYLGEDISVGLSSEHAMHADPTIRLLSICKSFNADVYLSGPAAKSYMNTSLFEDAGITIEWLDYSGFCQYVQLYPPFVHEVSIVDVLFMLGRDTISQLK